MWAIGEPGLVVRGRAYPQLGLIHDKEQRWRHCQQCSLLPPRSLGMELAASVMFVYSSISPGTLCKAHVPQVPFAKRVHG